MQHTTASISGVAIAVCLSTPAIAQTPATWVQPVNVAASPGMLTKTGGCDSCPDAGAFSQGRVGAGGYAEFVAVNGHRLAVGLTAQAAPSTTDPVDYAVSLWPHGAFEIRERGVYRGEGSFAAGDRFRIAVEAGQVVYRRNGTMIRTSAVEPSGPLTLAVTLCTTGASIQDAVLSIDTEDVENPQQPPAYGALVDRQPRSKPALPVIGPAGYSIVDPVFGSRVVRVTDHATRPASLNRSYRTPSSPHQNAWSAGGSYFYVVSGDGTVVPYSFDASTGTSRRVQPSATGAGGLTLNFYIEPQFSYVSDTVIYGSRSAAPRSIDQYDFATGVYTRLIDLDTVVSGLSGTYIGGLASSAGPTERVMVLFGGTSQDRHHYVVLFDKANPQRRLLLDTHVSPLAFTLHHAAIDRSGRYVMLYPTYADLAPPRLAAQSYLWDTATGLFTEMGVTTLPYGHDSFGYGVSVNQDCCASSSWDAAQWQLRALAAPLTTRDLITNVLSPKAIYLAEHSTWNNARPDRLVPFVSALFRSPISTVAWRAWDEEIIAVQTDAPHGADATVWRFAHHRSDIRSDIDPMAGSFWYQPRPNVSPDGRWALFTSNWEKTLGIDPRGTASTSARQDVFLVELR